MIEVANQTGSFLGHHHHHHAHHGHGHEQHEFQVPEKLTTGLGLYALKKLNAINPHLLSVRESRLLEPVTPGPITYFITGAWYLATGVVGVHLWRTKGLKGFASLSVLPLLGLIAAKHVTLHTVNYVREQTYSLDRKRLVTDYVEKYGEQFLLNVLHPAFRL